MTLKERPPELTLEEKVSLVSSWINSLPEAGASLDNISIPEIDPLVLRDVLSHCGANFDALDNPDLRHSMSQFSNKDRSAAMRAVWGEEFYEATREWMESWALDWKDKNPKLPLPVIIQTRDGNKVRYYNSGPLAFWGEFTAYAAGAIPEQLFQEHMEVRIYNGVLKTSSDYQGKEDDRHKNYICMKMKSLMERMVLKLQKKTIFSNTRISSCFMGACQF